MVNELKTRYPELKEYNDRNNRQSNFLVQEYINESVYQEINHYSVLGDRLDFFQIDPGGSRVGDGYTYMISSNTQALEDFVNLVNEVISNPDALQSFRDARVQTARPSTYLMLFSHLSNDSN